MNKTFSAADIEKCIEIACDDLKIDKENLKYEVLEEKRGFFKKNVSIMVEVPDERSEKTYGYSTVIKGTNDGAVCIKNGKVIVKNPTEDGLPASIICSDNIHIKLNGLEVKERFNIFEDDVVEITIDDTKPSRKIDIDVSPDKMEVYISITYKTGMEYKLKDLPECSNCIFEVVAAEEIKAEAFTYSEVERELTQRNITFGIIKDRICENLNETCSNILIAKGVKTQDAVDDSIEVKFRTDNDSPELIEDNNGNIDFKSIGSINSVSTGDILSVKIEGHEGTDGMDVYGRLVKVKPMKKLKLKAGAGCMVKGNHVVAIISGKPCLKGSVFYVFEVHEVNKDIDISTGNIKFVGDVVVYGSIKEGMELDSGNSVVVYKDVERAKIISGGNISIHGNIIASNIVGGGKDVVKLRLLENVTKLQAIIENIIEMIIEIKKYNLLGDDKRDGEIIKVLIDSRFKNLPRLCLSIITDTTMDKNDFSKDRLIELIKGKLLGLAPVNIKHQSELSEIKDCILEKIEWINANLSIPVNVKFDYCQDSNIESSGDVVITGRGEYVSNIRARGNIIFTNERSVARGGIIVARDRVECKSVGSHAGVSTRLEVEKDGHIYADLAYHNTVFAFGNREYALDADYKNVHAFIDSNDDIVVDKLIL